MNKCLFTYNETLEENYSKEGLKLLNKKLNTLNLFPYSREEQENEVLKYSGKISIQGVQPKLSGNLSLKKEVFEIVESRAQYILKPQTRDYKELPQNEDLTMKLALMCGIETPWHGLIRASDNSLIYVVKRFDRFGKNSKRHQEDFAQLMGASRVTKYQADMEKVAETIEKFCTFPTLQWRELFKRIIFSFLIGNEDMHLKNFSLIKNKNNIIQLSPAYDLVNTTIAMVDPIEEMALSLGGKKHGFLKIDFMDYANEYLFINEKQSEILMSDIKKRVPDLKKLVMSSFLSDDMKKSYIDLMNERLRRLA